MDAWFAHVLAWFALPQYGLATLFLVALVSATLVPMGSEPALFGLIHLRPDLFWWAVAVATVGNTLGGAISWATGYGAERAYEEIAHRQPPGPASRRALALLERWGPRACLLSWLPVVGDPLCAVAGWLKLPFWRCVGFMAVGKCARYVTMTWLLMVAWPWLRPLWHGVPA